MCTNKCPSNILKGKGKGWGYLGEGSVKLHWTSNQCMPVTWLINFTFIIIDTRQTNSRKFLL